MDSEKLKSMLKSEDESMRQLAVNICKGASLKDMDALERVILFLHSKDEELLEKARMIMINLKRNIRYLERLSEHLEEYSHEGYYMLLEIQEMYMKTKKLTGFFYTEKEFEKLQKEAGGTFKTRKPYTFWESNLQIKLKNFKQTNHGKK